MCELLVSAEVFGYQENDLGYNSLKKTQVEVECNN
jgi:hypothetical protein